MASAIGLCANCGKQAGSRCSRCLEAPEPDTGDMSSIFYCTKACQTVHWSIHRADCKTRVYRKKLFRTADILKAAFLVYRALEFDVELCKIELRGNILYLYDNQKDLSVPPKRGHFPEDLTNNAEHREAALCSMQCSAAFPLVCRLIYKLLAGVACQLEALSVNVGNRLLTTQTIPGPDSPNIPALDSTTLRHVVIKIKLQSNNEVWIIDMTGAQYGFRDILAPYTKYMSTHQCSIAGGPFPYDYTETHDLDIARITTSGARQGMLEAERPARHRFASFANGVNKDLLDGSSTEFEDKLKAFKTALKLHMSFGA